MKVKKKADRGGKDHVRVFRIGSQDEFIKDRYIKHNSYESTCNYTDYDVKLHYKQFERIPDGKKRLN